MKCNKCKVVCEHLLCSFDYISFIGSCYHIYCSSCFKKENDFDFKSKKPLCPCCKNVYYEHIKSVEEALLKGEAAYLINDALYQSLGRDKSVIHSLYNEALSKYEKALLINPSNIVTMYSIIYSCLQGLDYCEGIDSSVKNAQYDLPSVQRMVQINSAESHHYLEMEYECCLDLIEQVFDSHGQSRIHILHDNEGQPTVPKLEEFYNHLALIFLRSGNIPEGFKCSKLAYEICLRSPLQARLDRYKNNFRIMKDKFAKEPPLRFAVGDEVEFLHELETGNEWRLGKIIEVYYRERDFSRSLLYPIACSFSALLTNLLYMP